VGGGSALVLASCGCLREPEAADDLPYRKIAPSTSTRWRVQVPRYQVSSTSTKYYISGGDRGGKGRGGNGRGRRKKEGEREGRKKGWPMAGPIPNPLLRVCELKLLEIYKNKFLR